MIFEDFHLAFSSRGLLSLILSEIINCKIGVMITIYKVNRAPDIVITAAKASGITATILEIKPYGLIIIATTYTSRKIRNCKVK